jgi:hypothetical protein
VNRASRAAQVDRADAVEGLLAQFVQRLVATPNADPDIVVQDINAAPTRPSGLHRGGERLFLGHVGGEGHALATLRRHRSGLLGGGDKPVDRQDPGALLREAERGRAAIADPLTGALPGPNDHSDLAFETHGKHSLQQVFKDASMVPPFASQPGRPDYLPIASFILDTPARARVAGGEGWEPTTKLPVAEPDFDDRQAQVYRAPSQAGLGTSKPVSVSSGDVHP